jgi:hypothetical protein
LDGIERNEDAHRDVEFSSIKTLFAATLADVVARYLLYSHRTQSNHFSTLCCLKACFFHKQWEGAGGRVHPVGNVATEFTNIIKELILIGTSQKLNKFDIDTHTSGKAEEAGKILNCVIENASNNQVFRRTSRL